ncbi:pentapeptide repeat-containing protein [Mycoavidus sp. SF9855]|uniref:WD40 repeat domain-containing protein n=1 Tax=Mycoavidus sp. SF9855 TaxID=2968475 RepID=UPI00211BFE96|nr:pentapeptide repeat-containing protein [Mycoavidus sp. SF9855]UUM21008.1 pentapeptide repeat-containing protein [Mycoavidus sp. SF9855]
MLSSISNSALTHYPATQKTVASLFLKLPLEIQEEIEKSLDGSSRHALFKALTTVTRDGESIEAPALKLHLIKERIQAQYQESLISSDEGLKKFALGQLETLSDAGQLDKVVEKLAFFELVCLLNAPEVFSFLREKIHQNAQLKEKLLSWVERSKTEKVQAIAANALTVLVKTGVQFNSQDLKGIRVPGADLSYGMFDSAQLQGADLSQVNFSNSWLCHADLSAAKMAGVRFGEWAYLQEGGAVYSCAYSPDGKNCAVGLNNGTISVYTTSNWKKSYTLRGHTNSVYSVVYSPNGAQIASGSDDKTVRLWDAHSGAAVHTLRGHTNSVYSVVYSPSGAQIASGSDDKTVRLWDAHSGAAGHTLRGHTVYVRSVVYSPNGDQIASGSFDKTVRLWDAQSGAAGHTLRGHTAVIRSVVYSPSGSQIASGSLDQTVRLWEVASGECLSVIQDFAEAVYSVAWKATPEGSYLLAGSGDKLVRQWELIERVDGVHAHLRWMSPPDHKLMVEDTLLEGAVGLSEMNLALLKQRGAAVLSDLA